MGPRKDEPKGKDNPANDMLLAGMVLGDRKRMEDAVEAGADINARYYSESYKGATALQIAVNRNLVTGFYFLIELDGIMVNVPDKDGVTPLHEAGYKSFPIFKKLLDKGADVTALDRSGSSPAHWVAGDTDSSKGLAKLEYMLKTGKVDLKQENSEGLTVRMIYEKNSRSKALIEEYQYTVDHPARKTISQHLQLEREPDKKGRDEKEAKKEKKEAKREERKAKRGKGAPAAQMLGEGAEAGESFVEKLSKQRKKREKDGREGGRH